MARRGNDESCDLKVLLIGQRGPVDRPAAIRHFSRYGRIEYSYGHDYWPKQFVLLFKTDAEVSAALAGGEVEIGNQTVVVTTYKTATRKVFCDWAKGVDLKSYLEQFGQVCRVEWLSTGRAAFVLFKERASALACRDQVHMIEGRRVEIMSGATEMRNWNRYSQQPPRPRLPSPPPSFWGLRQPLPPPPDAERITPVEPRRVVPEPRPAVHAGDDSDGSISSVSTWSTIPGRSSNENSPKKKSPLRQASPASTSTFNWSTSTTTPSVSFVSDGSVRSTLQLLSLRPAQGFGPAETPPPPSSSPSQRPSTLSLSSPSPPPNPSSSSFYAQFKHSSSSQWADSRMLAPSTSTLPDADGFALHQQTPHVERPPLPSGSRGGFFDPPPAHPLAPRPPPAPRPPSAPVAERAEATTSKEKRTNTKKEAKEHAEAREHRRAERKKTEPMIEATEFWKCIVSGSEPSPPQAVKTRRSPKVRSPVEPPGKTTSTPVTSRSLTPSTSNHRLAPPTQRPAAPTQSLDPPTQRLAPPTQRLAPPTQSLAPPTHSQTPPTHSLAPPTQTMAPSPLMPPFISASRPRPILTYKVANWREKGDRRIPRVHFSEVLRHTRVFESTELDEMRFYHVVGGLVEEDMSVSLSWVREHGEELRMMPEARCFRVGEAGPIVCARKLAPPHVPGHFTRMIDHWTRDQMRPVEEDEKAEERAREEERRRVRSNEFPLTCPMPASHVPLLQHNPNMNEANVQHGVLVSHSQYLQELMERIPDPNLYDRFIPHFDFPVQCMTCGERPRFSAIFPLLRHIACIDHLRQMHRISHRVSQADFHFWKTNFVPLADFTTPKNRFRR